MAKQMKGTAYVADPSYVLPRKSTGPAATCNGPKRACMNMKPSAPKVANSGVKKA